MSSSYPITKSVRWRMKDFVSCFNACKLPLVDEENETNLEISPPFPPATSVNQYSNASNRSQMVEEEFIVFCFRENGEIHVIEDMKSTGSSHQIPSKNVNRKLMYGENVEEDEVSINIQVVRKYKEDKKQEMSKDDICISSDKAKEEVKNNEFVEENTSEFKQEEGSLLESSSSSNLSSESTSSFSFPILFGSRRSWEWTGSRAVVPRLEDEAPRSSNSEDDGCRLHFCSF